MSANVESMAFVGEVPWHGLGKEVSPDLSPEEMLNEAGLNWQVEQAPLFATNVITKKNDLIITGHRGLVRVRKLQDGSEQREPIGICGSKYQVTQNETVFKFFDKFMKAGKMKMHTAGALTSNNGTRVWGLAATQKGFKLPGGDQVNGYLLLAHPHIWGESMQIKFTNIRVVCNNTYSAAIADGGGFRMTHTYAFDATMAAKAEETLGLSTQQLQLFEDQAKLLASKVCKEAEALEYLADLFKVKETAGEEMTAANLNRTASLVYDLVETQPGHELKAARGTWWGMFNAVTYAVDHRLGNSRNTALESAWFGSREKLKQRALSRALDFAKAA